MKNKIKTIEYYAEDITDFNSKKKILEDKIKIIKRDIENIDSYINKIRKDIENESKKYILNYLNKVCKHLYVFKYHSNPGLIRYELVGSNLSLFKVFPNPGIPDIVCFGRYNITSSFIVNLIKHKIKMVILRTANHQDKGL